MENKKCRRLFLYGNVPVMKIRPQSSAKMINRGGRIPAPMQSLKN